MTIGAGTKLFKMNATMAKLCCVTESVFKQLSLQDILLPKLIAGEIRVKDAEKFLRRVA